MVQEKVALYQKPFKQYDEKVKQEVKEILCRTPGIPVRDLRYSDLALPSLSCHGIYVFCEGNNYHLRELDTQTGTPRPLCDDENACIPWYIGSATGTSMVGRIGAHFAPRLKDFENILLKHIAYSIASNSDKPKIWLKPAVLGDQTNRIEKILAKALPIIMDLELKVVFFKEITDEALKKDIQKLESALIRDVKPAFNYPKRFGNRQFIIVDNQNQTIHL